MFGKMSKNRYSVSCALPSVKFYNFKARCISASSNLRNATGEKIFL